MRQCGSDKLLALGGGYKYICVVVCTRVRTSAHAHGEYTICVTNQIYYLLNL